MRVRVRVRVGVRVRVRLKVRWRDRVRMRIGVWVRVRVRVRALKGPQLIDGHGFTNEQTLTLTLFNPEQQAHVECWLLKIIGYAGNPHHLSFSPSPYPYPYFHLNPTS